MTSHQTLHVIIKDSLPLRILMGFLPHDSSIFYQGALAQMVCCCTFFSSYLIVLRAGGIIPLNLESPKCDTFEDKPIWHTY